MHNDSQINAEIEHAKDGFGVVEPKQATALINHLTTQDWAQAAKLYQKDASKPDGFYIQANGNDITIHNDMTQAKKIAGDSNAHAALEMTKRDAGDLVSVLTLGLPTMAGTGALMGFADGAGALAGAALGGEIFVGALAAGGIFDYGVNFLHANSIKADATRLSQQSADITLQSKSNTTVKAHLT